jgi:hypothetical protein
MDLPWLWVAQSGPNFFTCCSLFLLWVCE